MRSLNATLLTAMNSGQYDPYFLVTIQDTLGGNVLFTAQPTGYELSDLELTVTVQMPAFMDVPFYRTSVVLTRGVTVLGSQYTLSTSTFRIISSIWDGNFQTFRCHLIPRVFYSASGDQTYQAVITAFCSTFGKTAVFLTPGAAWLNYQFLPTGKTLTLNNAQTFFQELKRKYFIFACDNGSDQILFYTAFTHVASPQYSITGYRFDVDYNVDQRRQYIWRDENETVHKTVPSFALAAQPDASVQSIVAMLDLGMGVVLAGSYKNAYHGGKIFRSIDYGVTWDAGYDLYAINPNYSGVYSFVNLGGGIVLACGYWGGFILRSIDYGVTWTDVQDMGVDTTTCLTDCENGVVLCGHVNPAQVWRSTDYGLTWSLVLSPGAQDGVYAICYVGNGVCLVGSSPGGKMYRSTNYGANWTLIGQLGAETAIYSLLNLGNNIVLAGTFPNGKIYKSTDGGQTWPTFYQSAETYIFTLNTLGAGVVLAGTGQNGKVYRSVDYGVNWAIVATLGTESSIRSFLTLGNGSTLAGTGEHAYIYKSLNAAADLDIIHNLGFLPSTAVEPSAYFLLAQPKFEPFPVHLKYQSSDFIRINLLQGGIYDFTCAQVTEILDLNQKHLPFRMLITQTPWLSNTVSGPLPGTIERVASYTPLVTTSFTDILTQYDNNLQAAMDRLDDHHHGAQLYNFDTEKATPDQADLFALVDSLTQTHLTRKLTWAELRTALGIYGLKSMSYLTSTTLANYTVPAGVHRLHVRAVGGGAGGGGTSGGAATSAAAAGGGGGAYAEQIYSVNPADVISYQVGAGGAGGAAGFNTGSVGLETDFGTLVVPGGNGGPGMAAGTIELGTNCGSGGGFATNALFTVKGGDGIAGIRIDATFGYSGNGGTSFVAGAVRGRAAAAGAGNTASGKGGGGSGAKSVGAGDYAGGSGADGVIIVEEYG